ncbi:MULTISPECIES: DUF3791 domain-containing protein [unclassified Adlercreutzia]|uniref:DUF3791 domain-containing protein n=1 Tax=unclassified Adlercreutzia TaxID=2636013 RepID=UPI00197CE693|nr:MULTISPECIES: DUF3791 domain-containing protein [unclassified Adlercreutzia]
MSAEGKQTVLQMKYARIIATIAEKENVSAQKALSIFYNSETMPLIQEGVADLHCRSDEYLAEEILRERPNVSDT